MSGIPSGLQERRLLGPEWGEWLDRLARLRDELVEGWTLEPDGKPTHGFGSLVLPVRDPDGVEAVLKVSYDGDDESEHEALALQHWHGDGTVRLLRADPRRRALLLERLPGPDLRHVGDIDACEIVAGFYARLHRPALPQLRPLTAYVARWLADLRALGTDLPVPRRMVEQALHLGDALVTDAASIGVVVHGDLHFENVMGAEREPWLVIDPKPMSGDPHWEPAPMLWNRWAEMEGDVRGGIRRRFHTLVDVAGLDEDRARDWVVVRMVVDASWSIHDARRADRALTSGEQEWITRCISLVKAVQD